MLRETHFRFCYFYIFAAESSRELIIYQWRVNLVTELAASGIFFCLKTIELIDVVQRGMKVKTMCLCS